MADLFLTLTGADDKIKAHKIGAAGAKHHPVEGRPTAAERAAFQKKRQPLITQKALKRKVEKIDRYRELRLVGRGTAVFLKMASEPCTEH